MKSFKVDIQQLEKALHEQIKELDMESLSDLAQHVFGGFICVSEEDIETSEVFIVHPNYNYCGGLDKYKMKE